MKTMKWRCARFMDVSSLDYGGVLRDAVFFVLRVSFCDSRLFGGPVL
ncbi:hypothetical protein [Gluconacetobacter diazotrophicus]|nr:hypothetical protein [Gluconacetobacter diazotrophicus]